MNNVAAIKNEIAKYSRLVYDRNLVGAAGGNISARCCENYLITAGGIALRDVAEENIIMVDADGKVVDGCKDLKPSKETEMHLRIYRGRPDINCVIHVHPMHCTGISVTGKTIPTLTASAMLKLKEIPFVGYADPGSEQLALKVEEAVKNSPQYVKALLLEKHGIMAYDSCLCSAFDIAELVEESARVAFVAANYKSAAF